VEGTPNSARPTTAPWLAGNRPAGIVPNYRFPVDSRVGLQQVLRYVLVGGGEPGHFVQDVNTGQIT
jgi:hypothetical protein